MARFVFSAFADEAGRSLDEQIRALKENGIDYIEPRNVDGKGIITLTDEEILEIKRKLDENGIKVNSLGSPIGKYKIEEDFEPHLKDTIRALEICNMLETKNMRMFSFFTPQDDLLKYRDEVMRRLRIMVTEAKKYGVDLCHENESRIYGQMPREVRDILTTVPELYGVFDAANFRMNDGDVMEGIEATLINLKYLHIKDAIFSTKTITPAGEGEGRLAEIIDLVNEKTDAVVYLTLEPHLKVFDAYKDIDEHELKGTRVFKTNREAFDFAVSALRNLLIKQGYRKDENNEWIK